MDRVAKLLGYRLPAQRVDVEVVGPGGEDEESDDGLVRVGRLQVVVEPRQRLDKQVGALVHKLVAPGSEEEQGLVQVKVVKAGYQKNVPKLIKKISNHTLIQIKLNISKKTNKLKEKTGRMQTSIIPAVHMLALR